MEDLFLRVGKDDSAYYLDIADDTGSVIKIDSEGRTTFSGSHSFRRHGLQPLCLPEDDGDINLLRNHVRLSDDDFKLLVVFLVECFRPETPKPVLCVTGEAGSSKSTLVKMISSLVDCSGNSANSLPVTEKDLMVAANKSWLLVFDNISTISPKQSDWLCSIATGKEFRTRKLYTDDQEFLVPIKRPIILSGIGDIVTRQDLIDRCISIRTLPVESGERRTETEVWEAFQADRPKILGALLDAFSGALKVYDQVTAGYEARMQDFIQLGCSLEQALDWDEGSFVKACRGSNDRVDATILEDDPVIEGIVGLIGKKTQWQGPMKKLLTDLKKQLKSGDDEMPAGPRKLAAHLKQIAGKLRRLKIRISFPEKPEYDRRSKKPIRKYVIEAIPPPVSSVSSEAA